jgi:hypothetical protein
MYIGSPTSVRSVRMGVRMGVRNMVNPWHRSSTMSRSAGDHLKMNSEWQN